MIDGGDREYGLTRWTRWRHRAGGSERKKGAGELTPARARSDQINLRSAANHIGSTRRRCAAPDALVARRALVLEHVTVKAFAPTSAAATVTSPDCTNPGRLASVVV